MDVQNRMLEADTHLVLVSAQAAPNLLPALDPEIKPERAVLVVSEKMKARADALEGVLREVGVHTSRVVLEDEHDFVKLQNALLEVAARHDGDRIALNVTGGTKLMALAAQAVATEAKWEVFYVDLDTDEVIALGPSPRRKKLASILRLPHYLRAYGYKVEKEAEQPPAGRDYDKLLKTLIVQIGSLEKPLGRLNALAHEAEAQRRLEVPMDNMDHHFENLLRNFEEAGVLRIRSDKLRFASEADRAFAKGGWLEHHVYRIVAGATAELGIRDKAANLVVIDDTGVKNELDVAFMARNRLFVIECKTMRMDKEGDTKANDALFKLAEVSRRVGGLGSRGILASYRPLADAEKGLARALGLEWVCGPELQRLDERLKRWVKS